MYPQNPYQTAQTPGQLPWQQPMFPQAFQSEPQRMVFVTGLDGAKAYQMTPNSSAALFDDSKDMLYVKTTDGAGFPTIRTFELHEIHNSQHASKDFITREEFNIFQQSLMERMSNAQQPVACQPADADQPA